MEAASELTWGNRGKNFNFKSASRNYLSLWKDII